MLGARLEFITRSRGRIFVSLRETLRGGHVIVNNDHKFPQKELQDGLDLWIDARDTRRPYRWNGIAEVHFSFRMVLMVIRRTLSVCALRRFSLIIISSPPKNSSLLAGIIRSQKISTILSRT
ncbi:hypothetical protein BDV26DRAFT_276070 [Aspergillus bertholletiae]|uniref:Uncharacterized protein n=1 Tax=Aspergillus bertholletiae TaxID=1226010 RepID=A0A5N7ANL7_9EURO|nr:hypothetical protein BDV26DRAFT_276070 [Aspergillus bertholletiae]